MTPKERAFWEMIPRLGWSMAAAWLGLVALLIVAGL